LDIQRRSFLNSKEISKMSISFLNSSRKLEKPGDEIWRMMVLIMT
jgi:hypothetical protein